MLITTAAAQLLERLSGLLQLGGGPDLLQVQLLALVLVLVQNLIYVLALHAVAYWIFPRLRSSISEPPVVVVTEPAAMMPSGSVVEPTPVTRSASITRPVA